MKKEEIIIKQLEKYKDEQENRLKRRNPSYIQIEKECGTRIADNLAREFWAGFQTAISIIKNRKK